MAGKSTISITFKLDGDGKGFRAIAQDANGLKKVLTETISEAQRFNANAINFAAIAAGIDQAQQSVSQLQSVLKGLTDAHAAQIEAETQLAVNMRNTMGAREEDIQSIKNLCAAQQELGVIGDEVQLSGAQELATYLSEKQSLEKLIPVMNDMLAQQYGLNASQENAAQIATMLGKVMDGQTGALSRYGYTFDDTQEQILKFGTEAQRAAVLCDVVSSSVGGMNAELAKTDDGKQKQLENTIGDLKEQLGGLVQGAMPFVTIAANTMLALTGVVKFTAGVKAASIAVMSWNVKQKALTTLMFLGTGSIKKATQAANIYGTAAKGSAASTTALKIALRGLLISTGIGIAIAALTTVIEYFVSSTDNATESTNKFLDAEERAKREAEQLDQLRKQEASTLTNTRAALEINITKLKEFNGTKEREKKLVDEMNDTYGDTMGYFSSIADWYEALVANSEAYCRQMVIEARTRMLANQIAQKEQETHDLIYDDSGKKRKYSTKRTEKTRAITMPSSAGAYTQYVGTGEYYHDSDLDKANEAIAANNAAVANLRNQMKEAAEDAAKINFRAKGKFERPDDKPKGGSTTPTVKEQPAWTENAQTLKEYTDNIKILDELLQTSTIDEAVLINQQRAAMEAGANAIRNAGKETEKNTLQWHENATTLGEITENIRILDERLQTATMEEAATINGQREALQKQAEAIRNVGKAVEETAPKFNASASNLGDIENNISILNDQLKKATIEEAALINKQIDAWNKKADAVRNAGRQSQSAFETMREGYGSIKGIGSGIEGITSALEGNGNAWQTVTGIVDGFLQIYDGIKTIVGIINMLSTATTAHTTAKAAEAVAVGAATGAQTAEAVAAEATALAQVPVIAANKLATASYMELAAAAYFAAHAYIPFAGFGIASGFVSAAAGIVKAIGTATLMPFADGGIVSGPTVGLIGEYAGASNNPEVVAPLDKLRGMLNPVGEPVIIGGTLRASGREIICVLANETRIASKSGRKTNIKL